MGATVRVGVIGRGFGARSVAPVFAATDGCEVVDVVSARDEQAVDALCARADVDLISVHSPPFLHLAHVRRVIEAGHAVLCDKPFGLDVGEAQQMVELASDAGAVNLLNFEFRHHVARGALRDVIQGGGIGTPQHVLWTSFASGWRHPLRPYGWLFDAARGGGWINAWGSHIVDWALWTFGEVVEASAVLRTDIPERPDADGRLHACTADDGFTATLRARSGSTISIDSTFVAPLPSQSTVVAIGDEGVATLVSESIESVRALLTVRRADGSVEERHIEDQGELHEAAMTRAAPLVLDAVRERAAAPGVPTFVDGLACARVLAGLRGTPTS